MILLECNQPFRLRPRRKRMVGGWHATWLFFTVAYVPYDFNGYVEGIAHTGIEMYLRGALKLKSSS